MFMKVLATLSAIGLLVLVFLALFFRHSESALREENTEILGKKEAEEIPGASVTISAYLFFSAGIVALLLLSIIISYLQKG